MKCILLLVKKSYCWIWIAVDRLRKRFLSFVCGDRSTQTGRKLWDKLKDLSLGVFATDHWQSYENFIPPEQHIQSKVETFTVLADSGYQGIQDYHAWSLIPIKKSKGRELSEAEKAFNRELSRRRIIFENINAKIKVFKIMSHQYRNRRQIHLLRTKLVGAILNAELAT